MNNDKNINFEVISNPEFLAEGTAINDLFKSDRVLIGGEKTKSGLDAVKSLYNIYKKWIPEAKILTTNVWSAELSKLVSNAMLAQRISSINSISSLCEKTGADIEEVSKAVGMDSRIGPSFLNSSIGFGGSCFKKDILNLVYISKYYGLDEVAEYWKGVVDINEFQTNRFSKKIVEVLNQTIKGKNITILGWAFKKNTNDSRESASILLAKNLLMEGAIVNIYDPMVDNKRIIKDIKSVIVDESLNTDLNSVLSNIKIHENLTNCFKDSHLIAICTEWDEFKNIDWEGGYQMMNKPAWLFDGRNILDQKKLSSIGFKTFFIGK